MAVKTWTGNAAAVRQIDLITVAGVWAAADTATMTINGKGLVVTIGTTGTSTANVAAALRDAWNATSRLDSEGSTDATSNFGGQEHGEFSEATASIDPDSTSVVIITANTPGKPFTLTVTEATVGTGTAARTASQAVTGPHHWDNALNWDTGSVPATATADVVVFRDNDISVQYGLPTTLNITLVVYQSYTGSIGLPEVNRQNPAKPYQEYRTRYVKLDDDTATDDLVTHTFGIGPGNGSPLINVLCRNVDATPNFLTTSAIVHNTGTPQIPGTKALNLVINNDGSGGGTVTILKGSVDLGRAFSEASSFGTLDIGLAANANDTDVITTDHNAALTINQSAGTLVVQETSRYSLSTARTFNIKGGTCIARDLTTSGTVNVTVYNSRIEWDSSKTIAALMIGSGGILDAEKDVRAFTVTACDLYEGSSLLDGFARITYTAGVDLNRCGIDDVTIRLGNNRRLTPSTAA